MAAHGCLSGVTVAKKKLATFLDRITEKGLCPGQFFLVYVLTGKTFPNFPYNY